jgi:hypothetical protein
MLFVCFIATWIVNHFHWKPYIIIPILLLLMTFKFTGYKILDRLDIRPYYLFYFYIGYCLKAYRISPIPYAKIRNILLLAILGILFFYLVKSHHLQKMEFVLFSISRFHFMINSLYFFMYIYSIPATAALYLLCMRLVYIKNVTVSQRLISLTGLCFGVYLFQEFILQYMYYHTTIPQHVHPYILPWLGFIVTLTLSLLFTKLLLLTKVGRWMIG